MNARPGAASAARRIDPTDEAPHEHGGEPDWTEVLWFHLVDERQEIAGVATMEFRPGERRAHSALVLFLHGGVTATAMARAKEARRADLEVGRMRFEVAEPLGRWHLRCADVALMMTPGGARGTAGPIELDVAFQAWSPPAGSGARRVEVNQHRFTSIVSSGAFAQPGGYTGSVRIGDRTIPLEGTGLRGKAWGPQIPAERFSVAFGPDLAIAAEGNDAHVFTGATAWSARVVRGDDGRILVEGADAPMELRTEILSTLEPAGDAQTMRSMVRFAIGERAALGLVERLR